MTNILCATYPELWRAASVYSGVAAGCFISSSGGVDAWNSSCAEGQVSKTSAQWAAIVRAMHPTYTGAYPPIQEYHGTADTTLFPPNLNEEVKEWAGIFGYNAAASTQVLQNTLLSGHTKSIYGSSLQGILEQDIGHTDPAGRGYEVVWVYSGRRGAAAYHDRRFYYDDQFHYDEQFHYHHHVRSLERTTMAPGCPPAAEHWDHCGGIGWTSATTWCAHLLLTTYLPSDILIDDFLRSIVPFTCTTLNAHYFQCL
ncbi:Alpha/Beta hydrolase protein [Mycena epipterygia]|nr:Alpha/Beta hydrolase protein [Mycena epipterygia]